MSTNGRNEFAAAACDGKVRFGSRADAKRVQKRRGRNKDRFRGAGDVYRCKVCHCWHLGQRAEPARPKHAWKRYRERYEGDATQ